MNKYLFILILFGLLIGIVCANVITEQTLDKELENTLKDNTLAQQGATTGYSFYTNSETGNVDYAPSNCKCHCECDN